MEHTGSYYAATVNDRTSYPELQGVHSADVCVVGAGFTGIATALTLAERGYSVTVVEANRVGWGASGRNGGQLIGGISGEERLKKHYGASFADTLWEISWRGNALVRERVDKYSIDCDLKPGYIDVAIKSRHLDELRAHYDELVARNFTYDYRLLSREETCEVVGTDAYIGGLVNMGSGHLHPLNLCVGEARVAAGLGVQIFEQSPVVHIEHGNKPRVATATGHVEADAVILAGNAYHTLERRHLSGLTFPAGSYIIATEPLAPDLVAKINPLDLAVSDMNNVLDYFRMSADGRLLFGGRCNYSGREPRSIKAAMVPRMLKIYPQLQDIRIDYEWGGKIGIVVNRIPALGRINGNIYYCQGYSGHGVNATHLMGEIMADAVTGTMEKFDLFANIDHFRIPLGQWFGNQIIALGMLYYRLKDIL